MLPLPATGSGSESPQPRPSFDAGEELVIDLTYDRGVFFQPGPTGLRFAGALKQLDLHKRFGERLLLVDQAIGAFPIDLNMMTNAITFTIPSTVGGLRVELELTPGLIILEGSTLSAPRPDPSTITLAVTSQPPSATRDGWEVLTGGVFGAPFDPDAGFPLFDTLPELIAELNTTIAGLEGEVLILSSANTQLEAELAAALKRIEELEKGSGATDPAILSAIETIEEALGRAVRRNGYRLPGNTPGEQLANLAEGIRELKSGSQRELYKEISGPSWYRKKLIQRYQYVVKKIRSRWSR